MRKSTTPSLLALAALSERIFGKGFSALGFLPSVLALALCPLVLLMRKSVTEKGEHVAVE